mmetsp:Transcript_12570/g.48970  ORF Transcript_12570/g.48970 Transcript_12570/m.48970 type:complete len:211 (+) Transcript_12570:1704-2336(+)
MLVRLARLGADGVELVGVEHQRLVPSLDVPRDALAPLSANLDPFFVVGGVHLVPVDEARLGVGGEALVRVRHLDLGHLDLHGVREAKFLVVGIVGVDRVGVARVRPGLRGLDLLPGGVGLGLRGRGLALRLLLPPVVLFVLFVLLLLLLLLLLLVFLFLPLADAAHRFHRDCNCNHSVIPRSRSVRSCACHIKVSMIHQRRGDCALVPIS